VSISEFTVQRPGCSCEGHYGIQIENNSQKINLTNNEIISDSVGINTTQAQDVIIAYNNFSQNYALSMCISNSSNILVTGNNMTGFLEGAKIASSSDIVFSNNIVSGSGNGVTVENSNDSMFCGNDFWQDSCGISLQKSGNNLILDNDFKDNFCDALSHNSVNSWDNGLEGNHWGNYTGVDTDFDGIGDTPYVMDANNKDNCPLMGTFTSFKTNDQQVDLISNSFITSFGFSATNSSQATLALNVAGQDGTQGFCRICIPKTLINGTLTVRFDGQVITEPQFRILPASNPNHTYIYINYTHSGHSIEIRGPTTIPEFPSIAFLTIFMLTTLLAVIVYRRKHPAFFRR
jgi:parallel beta-helix repeat protein